MVTSENKYQVTGFHGKVKPLSQLLLRLHGYAGDWQGTFQGFAIPKQVVYFRLV